METFGGSGARWWEEVRRVQVELMVRIGLEGGRLIDEDVIENEEKDAVCL